ncbi:tRNA pseudouridine(13) synthase TruD [Candidatus Woesearchaeota archaeon]|nr:tRNA pseudouridine(13) synthase TruD [Candidatus Woesearchaeota archaeon]
MYTIKQEPEDFQVTEKSTVRTKSSGKYIYFRLWKKDLTTMEALKRLATAWRVPAGALSYAGNKDRKAITEQTCGAYGITKEKLENTQLQDIKLTFLGYGDEPVHLGQLEGNQFRITVRNAEKKEIKRKFRNLFGEQRFSTNNAEIGKHIVKREFEQAVKKIVESNPQAAAKIRTHTDKKDWIGALRCIPRKLLLLYIHAYQSQLWNKAAMRTDKEELPIIGFGTEEIDETTQKILNEEKLKLSDFIIRELPEASTEGATRKVWAEAKQLKITEEDGKIILEFFLPKGSYATEFIRQAFQELQK